MGNRMSVLQNCINMCDDIDEFVECLHKNDVDALLDLFYEIAYDIQWTKYWREFLEEFDLCKSKC